jgi:hypothetical protein
MFTKLPPCPPVNILCFKTWWFFSAVFFLCNNIGNTILPFFFFQISGREKFILVAHDWGGVIAWNFVRKHHNMLQSYIIMNAPYTPTTLWLVFSNSKQFFMSWYVVWEWYLHFHAVWVGSLWLYSSRNSSVVSVTVTASILRSVIWLWSFGLCVLTSYVL